MTTTVQTVSIKPASFRSVSTATLRTQDLLKSFMQELESRIHWNGDYLSRPEHFFERDKFNGLVGEAQDCFGDNGEILPDKEEQAEELVNESLPDALSVFAPAYGYFGSHPGDGADFGYWPMEISDVRDQVEFSSTKDEEYPPDDFRGEWLHINERGNCTLYVRSADGKDVEIWSLV